VTAKMTAAYIDKLFVY